MAVFLINICKFNKCGMEFGTLVDLIQHIEENHIGELKRLHRQGQSSSSPFSYRSSYKRTKNLLYYWINMETPKYMFQCSPSRQITIRFRSPIVFLWVVFSAFGGPTPPAKRIPSFWSALARWSHSTGRAMPASGWRWSAKSPSSITATACPRPTEVILQQVRLPRLTSIRLLINHESDDELID